MTQPSSEYARAFGTLVGIALAAVGAAWLVFRPIPTDPAGATVAAVVTPLRAADPAHLSVPRGAAPLAEAPAVDPRLVRAGGEPPAPFTGLVEELAALSPALRVAETSCAGGLCVAALRISDPAAAATIRADAFAAALETGRELDAQPTFRWDEAAGTGFLWFVPNRLDADGARALAEQAEATIAALGAR